MLTIPLSEATPEQLRKALNTAEGYRASFVERGDHLHLWGHTCDVLRAELERRHAT